MVQFESGIREFEGKRALVTGGSRGIGAAVVRGLLDAGAQVVTSARTATSAPDGAALVTADVRTRAGVRALADAAHDALGGVDVLVENVGGAQPHPAATAIPDEEWQDALDLNFLASVRLDSLLAQGMRERGSGAIVHISSAAIYSPPPQFLHYAAAKMALETYSRGLASELAPHGIRVNTVTPGRVATRGGEQTRQQWARLEPGQDAAPVPMGREGVPEDIASAVLFLASDRANWVTGAKLIVDGGEFHRG